MRLIIVTILNLLLSVVSVSGQRNDAAFENLPERFQQYKRPELKDSITRKMDKFAHRIDSLRIHGYFDKKPLPLNLYLPRPHINEDNMVFNPGPSNDRMPNADVTTPGVNYTLKIVHPGGYFPKRYRFNPPYFRR